MLTAVRRGSEDLVTRQENEPQTRYEREVWSPTKCDTYKMRSLSFDGHLEPLYTKMFFHW